MRTKWTKDKNLMDRFARSGLVLVLTMAFSVLMPQGWYSPADADAAVGILESFANPAEIPSTTTNNATATYTPPAGSNRLMVLIVKTHTNNTTATTISMTYGDGVGGLAEITATPQVNTSNVDRRQVWIATLNEAQIASSPGNIVTVTSDNIGNGYELHIATYSGVEQTAPVTATGAAYSGTTTVDPYDFGTAISVKAEGYGIVASVCNQTTVSLGLNETYTGYGQTQVGATPVYSYIADKYFASLTTTLPSVDNNAAGYTGIAGITLEPYIVTDSTPPTVGTVNVTPTVGIYTGAAPSVTATLTDNESPVTSCEYTTNGSWPGTGGALSGSSPTWTCTGSPTGLSGALTINVRGLSTGGTGTGSSEPRTVDATAPSVGTLTVTPGNAQNGISWSGISDAQTGLVATGTYVLRFLTGATPPADCTAGAAVTGSPFDSGTTNTTHTGLVNLTQYSYRLCATNGVNLQNAGTTGSGTPTADTTAPTATGSVTASVSSGSYVPAAFTLSGQFIDNETAVLNCEYTTNGSTWSNVGVSITGGPTYTCSISLSGLSGGLTLNWRATSAGGGPTTHTQFAPTVDNTAPTDGSFTVTAGDAQNTLNWTLTPATDLQSGLRTANTYTIRYQAGSDPGSCSVGSTVTGYNGTAATYVHTALSNGTTYYYRVCAYDNVNNGPSAGAANFGMPSAAPPDTLSLSNNTPIASGSKNDTAAYVIMQRLQLDSDTAGDGQVILKSVTLDDNGASASAYNAARIYISTVSSATSTLPSGAVQIGKSTIYDGTSEVILLDMGTTADMTVTNGTSKYMYIVYDMASGQAPNQARSRVTAVGALGSDIGASGSYVSNIISLVAGAKATVTVCTDCHTNPPVDSATRDAANGRFRGSHNKHAVSLSLACTICHKDNGAAINHRNGNIDMLAQFATYSGAYSKGTVSGSLKSFPQSDNPIMNTCNNVSCHSTVQGANGVGLGADKPQTWAAAGPLTCSACHVDMAGSSATGRHVKHTNNTAGNYNMACSTCHTGYTSSSVNNTLHLNQTINVALPSGLYNGGTTSGNHAPGGGYGTCSTNYCHSSAQSLTGGSPATYQSPTWGASGSPGCGGCHVDMSVSVATSGSHSKHTQAPSSYDCDQCHTGYTKTTVTVATHVNSAINVAAGLGYSGDSTPANSNFGTCSTASCHVSAYSASTMPTPTWGNIAGCGSCHPINAATGAPDTGSHAKHLNGGALCGQCHQGAVKGSNGGTGHLDTTITVTAGYPQPVAKHLPATLYGTRSCNNASCHASAYGAALVTSPVWSVASGCSACHSGGGAFAANGAPATGSHATHLDFTSALCNTCHAGAVSGVSGGAAHTDGDIDVSSFTYPPNVTKHAAGSGYGLCSTVACHGGATPRWGTGTWDCIICHSNTFAKTLGVGTIRRIVGTGGDFGTMAAIGTTASRHLMGATTIVKWDCIICHREGQAGGASAGRTNKTYHMDASAGLIHLRNVDTVNENVGFVVNNRAWTTTDYRQLDSFCLTCHDADGAAAVSVNAANSGIGGNALKPFNSTDVDGNGFLKGTNALPHALRDRVIDVKGQFFAGTTVIGNMAGIDGVPFGVTGANYNGNNSQHAVIGRRYSAINVQWGSSNAAWASRILKKTGVNMQTVKETALLSCADCHVLDSGSGAHGGSSLYNLDLPTANRIDTLCQACHASGTYAVGGSGSSRINHSGLDGGDPFNVNSTSKWGPSGQNNNCLLCHAGYMGYTTVTRRQSYGGIHGNAAATYGWSSVGSSAVISTYRFFPGSQFKLNPGSKNGDGGWTTTNGAIGCYMYNSTTEGYFNCTRHSNRAGSETGAGPNYVRPLKY